MGLFSKKSQYQKQCEEKIEELCGGFFYNEHFERSVRMHNKIPNQIPHDRVKGVLKSECENGKLALEDIESRFDELLDLDCNTLDLKIRMGKKHDTSQFKTQDDIIKFMGPEYEEEYHRKLEENKSKIRKKMINDEIHFDFKDGVSVKLFTPEFGLKIKDSSNTPNYFQTAGIANEEGIKDKLLLTTYMKITDSEIIFNKALEDGGDLIIPFNSIESVERAGDEAIDINLEEYQKIQFSFVIDGVWSKNEKTVYLEDEFFRLVKTDKKDTKMPQNASNADELLKLVGLYEKGYLTKGEFEAEKSKLISSGFCPECGAKLTESDTFCPQCGRSI